METPFVKTVLSMLILCYVFNHAWAIDPDREYIRTPDSLGLDYESLVVQTSDGYDIQTWVYSADSEKNNGRLLILAYPDAGNMSYFVYHAAILSNQGYTVVTFDYRGFGKSTDFQIDKDMLYYNEFVTDLNAVAEKIRLKFPDKRLGIWGMSMGTIVAVKSLQSLRGKVDFVVAEGLVSDTSLIVNRILEQKNKKIGLPEDSRVYLKDLENLDVPLLIFAASDDKITTYEDALETQKTVRQKCKIVHFEGEHLAGFQVGDGSWGEYYVNQINGFLHDTFDSPDQRMPT